MVEEIEATLRDGLLPQVKIGTPKELASNITNQLSPKPRSKPHSPLNTDLQDQEQARQSQPFSFTDQNYPQQQQLQMQQRSKYGSTARVTELHSAIFSKMPANISAPDTQAVFVVDGRAE